MLPCMLVHLLLLLLCVFVMHLFLGLQHVSLSNLGVYIADELLDPQQIVCRKFLNVVMTGTVDEVGWVLVLRSLE